MLALGAPPCALPASTRWLRLDDGAALFSAGIEIDWTPLDARRHNVVRDFPRRPFACQSFRSPRIDAALAGADAPREGGKPARATILLRSANVWTTHARATAEPLAADGGAFALAAPAATQAVAMDVVSLYRRVAALGYNYAAPFRGTTLLRRAGGRQVGVDGVAGTPEPEGYAAAPLRLEHCLQTVLSARLEALEAEGAHLLLPIGVERLAWLAAGRAACGLPRASGSGGHRGRSAYSGASCGVQAWERTSRRGHS